MPAPNPAPLWSVSYIYAPGVPNPSSPSVPSSMSSSSGPLPAAARAPTLNAPAIPQHWRRVITECRVEPLEDPAQPGQGVSNKELLNWLCQILDGELRERGPLAGTPALNLLLQAIQNLPPKESAEFFEGLRRLKQPGHHIQATPAPGAGAPAKAGQPAAGKKPAPRKKPRK